MKPPLIDRIVSGSCRYAWLVALIGLLLAAGSVYYCTQHFALTANTDQLISPNLPWRKTAAAFSKAFPQTSDVTAVVIDGATPEIAEAAAARLAAALATRKDVFNSVVRPDSGPFFQKNGLMLLPLPQVEKTLGQLTQAQAFLGPLAADPSLRGVMTTFSTVLMGVNQGQAKLSDIDGPMKSLADALGKVEAGKPAFFSWQTLLAGGESPGPRLTRQFILVQTKLDFSALEPGAESGDLIHQIARHQGLDSTHGVEVRLTGDVPLADEQFGSLLDHVWLMVGAMVASILIMLWLAVRSVRIMACILAVTIIGLIITAAGGLLAVHRFNLISVAFIPLFVGLGVDFGIQFSVRYKAERLAHPDLPTALAARAAASADRWRWPRRLSRSASSPSSRRAIAVSRSWASSPVLAWWSPSSWP